MVLAGSETGKAYRSERNGVQIQSLDAIELKALPPGCLPAPFLGQSRPACYSRPFNRILSISRIIIPSAGMPPSRPNGWALKCVGTNHFMPENLAPYVPVLSRIKPVFNWVLWHWMRETYDRVDAVACPSRTAASILTLGRAAPAGLPHLLRGEYNHLPYRSIRRPFRLAGPLWDRPAQNYFLLCRPGGPGKTLWMCCCGPCTC